MEALDSASEAVRDALADGPRVKTDFHRELTERVPDDLRGGARAAASTTSTRRCGARRAIRGVLGVVGRDGRTPVYGAPPPAPPVEDPGGALARRYLQVHGPATPQLFRFWADAHAPAREARCGSARASSRPSATSGCSPRTRRSRRRRRRACGCCRTWIRSRARRTARCSSPTPPCASGSGPRSAAPGWCSSTARSRACGARARRASGSSSTLEPLRALTKAEREALAEEAERLAPFRGAETRRAGPRLELVETAEVIRADVLNSGSYSTSTRSIWAFWSLPA